MKNTQIFKLKNIKEKKYIAEDIGSYLELILTEMILNNKLSNNWKDDIIEIIKNNIELDEFDDIDDYLSDLISDIFKSYRKK